MNKYLDKVKSLWSVYSCCSGEHSFHKTCMAHSFTDHVGVKRKVIDNDKGILTIVTTFKSGKESDPWKTSTYNWKMMWGTHHPSLLKK